MYGLIINMCNLVMILQRILDVINFNNPISLLLVLGGLGECVHREDSAPFLKFLILGLCRDWQCTFCSTNPQSRFVIISYFCS